MQHTYRMFCCLLEIVDKGKTVVKEAILEAKKGYEAGRLASRIIGR